MAILLIITTIMITIIIMTIILTITTIMITNTVILMFRSIRAPGASPGKAY